MCPLYVAGLIGPGDRKSLQPMAARVAPADYDQLHHFVAVGPWDEAPLEAELLVQANRLVGGPDAILVIDDTALLKKGTHSVGVASQYAGVVGKQANCQSLVSLTLAKNEVPIPIVLRLVLPDTWIKDPERLRQAGVPEPFWTQRSKPEIALAELRRVMQAGVSFGAVLADAGYGISGPFRQALSALGLLWAVGNRADPEGLCGGCADDHAPALPRPTPQDAGSRSGGDLGRSHAGHGLMASGDMAAWHQRPAEGEVRGRAGAGCRRASGSSARACRPASAGR
jgi:SRSO17 transposase